MIRTGVSRGMCGSCDHAFIRVDKDDREVVECTVRMYVPLIIEKPLKSCSQHNPKGSNSRWEMEKIAWIVTKDKKGKVGFNPPKKEE
jgi:hypothetical protein